MSYPHQTQYGDGPELVPGGLRVYRHYRIDTRGLTSTITTRAPVGFGVNVAKCLASEQARANRRCMQCSGTGRCVTLIPNVPSSLTYRSFLEDDLGLDGLNSHEEVRRDCSCLRVCKTPERVCQCGFYASYDPRLDFFQEYISQVTAHPGSAFGADIPPVFAVVEASGRVLMGSKGVRAEKMRVVAMVIDVEHAMLSFSNPYLGMDQFSYSRWAGRPGYQPGYWEEREQRGRRDQPGKSDMLQTHVDMLEQFQFLYGARSYGIDMDRMIRDHPQPDISHLIKEQNHG